MSGHLMCDGTLQFSPGEEPKEKVIMYLAENITAAEYWTEVIKTGIDRFGAESFSNRQRTGIIHCAECKFIQCNMSRDGYLRKGTPEFECRHWYGEVDPTDFCSCGARMIEQESENETDNRKEEV